MKKLLYLFLSVSFIFTACKKEEGCTDAIAANYNADAEDDDGSCTYSIIGVWTPTSILFTQTMSATVMGQIVNEGSFDTTMTAAQAGLGEYIEFTSSTVITTNDYGDLETDNYTISGNTITVTDDEGTETNSYTVTKTNLSLIFSNTETYTEDYMGQEATVTETSETTINCTR